MNDIEQRQIKILYVILISGLAGVALFITANNYALMP